MTTSGFDKEGSLEITLQVRDKAGNPTGKTRYFRTHSPEKLCSFFEQNAFRRVKFRKKIDKKEQLSANEAEKILESLYEVESQDEE